jgi:hypothetical protein
MHFATGGALLYATLSSLPHICGLLWLSGLACVGVCSTAVAAAVLKLRRGPVRFQVFCVCACVVHSPGGVVLVAMKLVNLRVIDRMQLIEGCMGSERGTWCLWRL